MEMDLHRVLTSVILLFNIFYWENLGFIIRLNKVLTCYYVEKLDLK